MKMSAFFAVVLALFLTGCDEDKSSGEKEFVHELTGVYSDSWGGVHIISNSVWDQGAMSGRFNIKYADNENDVIIAQNGRDNEYNPEKWSRFDYVFKDSKIYICQTVYDKNTQDEALDAASADRSKLDTGCNGFGWTEMVETVEESIGKDDAKITAWAAGFEEYKPGTDVDEEWQDAQKALGIAEGTPEDVVSLGNGGSIMLTFEKAVTDGEGYDFAVFENSLNDKFLELAFVEVSSDGTDFVRFDNYYLGLDPVDAFGSHEPYLIWGFAGKFKQGLGTQFDLSTLAGKKEVTDKTVDLTNITHIRIVDVLGDGSETDTLGDPIYDPYPTTGSAGFDLDAIGIMNVKE
ncbi:MAG TPA: hypothetical protein P5044_03400 [bacterium]|nr:hypothetical protein [bacterium]